VPVPCFLLFFCFRKATPKIFSELDKTKDEPPNIYKRRGATGQPHHRVVQPSPGPCPLVVRPPCPPPNAALPPIYFSRWEKPRDPINFLETYCNPPLSSTRDREGPEALPSTLPERGITTGGLIHHHACLRRDE
jgi:hypothetical protein